MVSQVTNSIFNHFSAVSCAHWSRPDQMLHTLSCLFCGHLNVLLVQKAIQWVRA